MTIVTSDPVDVNKNEKKKKKKTKKKKKPLNLRALAAEKTRKESVSSDEIVTERKNESTDEGLPDSIEGKLLSWNFSLIQLERPQLEGDKTLGKTYTINHYHFFRRFEI